MGTSNPNIDHAHQEASGLPADETEVEASLTPTDASSDPKGSDEAERKIQADAGLSPVIQQPGGAALSHLGASRSSDKLFRD